MELKLSNRQVSFCVRQLVLWMEKNKKLVLWMKRRQKLVLWMKSVIQCQKVSKIDLHVSKVVGTHSFHSSLCKGLTSGARSKMLRDGFLCRHFKSGCGVGLPAVLGAWVFVRKLVERPFAPFLSSGSLLSLSLSILCLSFVPFS